MKTCFSSAKLYFLGTLAGAALLTGVTASASTVAHYRFEDGSDGAAAAVAVDSSANGYDLLNANGAPVYSSDVPVSTIIPTGGTSALSMDFGSGPNALAGTAGEGLSLVEFDDFTVEGWVKLNNPSGWQSMVARVDSGGLGQNGRPQALFLLLNNGIDNTFWLELTTRENTTLLIRGGPVAKPDTWYHVAAVGDATAETLSLYVNGELVETVGGFTGLFRASPGLPWTIGRATYNGNPGDWLNGKVDEVRFSNVALQPGEFLNELSIVEQPQSVVVWSGEDVTFRTEVVSSLPTTLQWEVSTDNGETWAEIAGATSTSFSIEGTTLASDRNQYRAVATREDNVTVVSDAATLRVGDSQAPTPRNVVAHYRFEEGSVGGAAAGATDSSGNGHDLWEVVGGPIYAASVPAANLPQTRANNDASLDVAGGNFAVQGTDGDSLSQIVWDDFTIEAWVRFADVRGWQTMIGRDDRGDQNTDPHSLFRFENSGWNAFRVVAFGRDGNPLFVDSSHIFSHDTWTHVAVVGDTQAGTLTAYANGRPVGSAQGFNGLMIPDPKAHWTIGRGQWGGNNADWTNGQIDEVRFSAAALSPVEFLNFSHAVLNFALQPGDVTVPEGAEVVFSALAGGGGPGELGYQWQISNDGGASWSDIAGATAASYTIEVATLAQDANQYRVVASRGDGTEISDVATLSVTEALFKIVEQPQSIITWAGEDVTFRADVEASIPTTLQWEVSTDNGETWAAIGGATAESYSVEAAPLASDRNHYRLVVTSDLGMTAVSDVATLRVGDPAAAPAPRNVIAYYRFEDGVAGGAATSAIDSSGNGYHLGGADGEPLFSSSIPSARLHQTAEANALSMEFGSGQNALVGTANQGLSLVEFDNFTIETWVRMNNPNGWQSMVARVDSDGLGQNGRAQALFLLLNNGIDNRFWLEITTRDNVTLLIRGGPVAMPNTWYHLAAVGDADAGTLSLYVNGELVETVGGFTGLFAASPAMPWSIGRSTFNGNPWDWLNGAVDEVRFSDAALSPAEFLNFPHAVLNFALQPGDVTTPAGSSAAFSALAGGGGGESLSYQWQVSEDGGETWSDISGATGPSYTNEFATVAEDGNQYRVVASRGGDSAVSDAAELSVTAYPAPAIVQDLGAGQLAFAGQEFALTVDATGAGNLTYQWQRDGVDLEGQTGATLNFGVVGFDAAGTYSVIVTDEAGADEGFSPTTVTLSTVLSVAPSPAEAISLNFVGAGNGFPGFSQELGMIAPNEAAGVAPVTNWNNSPAGVPSQGTPMTLVNDLGVSTSAAATWSAANYWGARLAGGALAEKDPNQRIFHGYIEDRANLTATITGIPYDTYDVYVYPVGVEGASGDYIRSITVEGDIGTATTLYGRNFGGADAVTPVPFHLATGTSRAEAEATTTATVFRFAGVSGSSVTITHADVVGWNLGGIGGISIVNTTEGSPARPVFLSRPSGSFMPAGGTAKLSVSAKSVNAGGSLSYQWQKDGVDIAGATGSTLTINNASSADTGKYTVVVTDTSALGAIVNEASAPLVIVDTARPALISADMNSGMHEHMSGHGVLRMDGAITVDPSNPPADIGEGDTQWKRLAEGLLEPTYSNFTDSAGLGLPGVTFTATGASGSHDVPVGGGMDVPVEDFSGPLLRDYIFTTADGVMTMAIEGLKAFAGREVTLVVYAIGRDSTSWPNANGEHPDWNDVATVMLAAQNSSTGVAQSAVTDQVEGRDLRYNNRAHATFNAVVDLNGRLTWTVGPVPGEPGLNAFNGFQLLVTDQGDGPDLTPLQTWRVGYFGTTENSGDAAHTADPDGDGFNNLLEYALGSNPTVAGDALGAVTAGEQGGFLTLTFSHVDDPSLIYQIKASDDLSDGWMVIHTYNPFTTTGVEVFTDSVSVGGASSRFLLLNVSLNE